MMKKHGSSLILTFLLFTLCTAAVWFGFHGDYVAAAGLGVVALGGLAGYGAGLITMLGSLVGVAVAVMYAPGFGVKLEPAISSSFGTTGLTNRGIAIGTVGLAVMLVAALVASLITDRFTQRKSMVWLRWGGFLMGSVQAAVTVLLVLGGILTVCPSRQLTVAASPDLVRNKRTQPLNRSDQNDASPKKHTLDVSHHLPAEKGNGSLVLGAVEEVSQRTLESRLAPMVVQCSPFVQIRGLSEVQKTIETLSRDPERIQAILRHPKVMQLRREKRVNSAVLELQEDEIIAQVLNAQGPIDGSKIMAILNSPAVLRILDEKELISEAYRILVEVDPVLGNQAGTILSSIR